MLHYVAGAALMAMLLITVVDILGRWLFNSPLSGTVETIPLLLVIVVYLGFAHAEHQGDHISVDLLYTHLPRRAQHLSSILSHVFSTIVLVLVTWQLWKYAGVQQRGGYSTAVIEWPIHWFVRIAAAGAALLLLATVTEVIAEICGIPADPQADRNAKREAAHQAKPRGGAT